MNWMEYQQAYLAYDFSLCQLIVVSKVAYAILKDFPSMLPDQWQEKLSKSERAFAKALESTLSEKSRPSKTNLASIIEKTPDLFQDEEPGLINAILDSYFAAMQLNIPKEEISFVDFVYVQQLIMTYAQLDAFIADSIRAICRVRPDVLKSSKKIEWKDVIEAGDWQKILDILTEKYVFEFGWKSVVDRLDTMKRSFGLKFDFGERVMLSLELGELVRNLFVHNGGIVNQEFIDSINAKKTYIDELEVTLMELATVVFSPTGTVRKRLSIGDVLDLSKEFSDGVTRYARAVGGEIFVEISTKFFDKDIENLVGVHRFEDKIS